MDRLIVALLAGIFGFLLGLFAPGFVPAAQEARQAESIFLDVATSAPAPTRTPVGIAAVPRTVPAQTQIPPTLIPATPRPTSTPLPTETLRPDTPTPVSRTFTIKLRGGGEMTVNAQNEEAARNNVKSSGAIPAD